MATKDDPDATVEFGPFQDPEENRQDKEDEGDDQLPFLFSWESKS